MQQITLELTPLDHPYKETPTWKTEAWGEIKLSIGGNSIISGQWDVLAFIEWFKNHRDKLISLPFPQEYEQYKHMSYMQLHDVIGSQINDDTDIHITDKIGNELSNLLAGRLFFLSGSKIPSFIIGRDFWGNGEISLINMSNEDGDTYSVYKFDMDDFLRQLDVAISSFYNSLHHNSVQNNSNESS